VGIDHFLTPSVPAYPSTLKPLVGPIRTGTTTVFALVTIGVA